jgi:hypothetical protein
MSVQARFCIAWLLSLTVVLLLIGGFNVLIDPYDIFGVRRIAGFNEFKSAAQSHEWVSKPYQIERIKPRTVLIGSSTVDLGLNPDDPIWPQDLRPVYDFGLPGSDPLYQYRTLQDAVAIGPVRVAVIVLSFVDTLYPPPPTANGHNESSDPERRLLVTDSGARNTARSWQEMKDAFLATLSIDVLVDSITTAISQQQSNPLDLTDHGSMTEGAFGRVAATEGYAQLFRSKKEEYARKLNDVTLSPRSADDMRYWVGIVGQMIEFCEAHNVRPILVIAPYHADMMELIDSAGLWNAFEDWKAALTKVANQSSSPVALWDFTQYDAYSTEQVPTQRARGVGMRWFWEPVHFKKALGSLVLRRILTDEPPQFGVLLTPDNIQQHLADIRTARAAYLEKIGSGTSRVREAQSTNTR